MKLIICIEKKNGMSLFGKRQSQDNVLRQWIIDRTKGSRLWMSKYSAIQFADQSGFIADDNYCDKAEVGDYCFIENKDYSLEKVSEIILCKWNRPYPSDKFFDIDLKASGFKKTESTDIAGSSHDKITIEVYGK